MVDDFDAVLTRPAPVPADLGVRLSIVSRSVLRPARPGGYVAAAVRPVVQTMAIGPRFIGHVAMASHDDLVVIGHVADGVLQAWSGSASLLTKVSEFEAPIPAGGLVSLVRYLDEWHLFARNERGRSSHLVSTDLCQWTPLSELVTSFPTFGVSGVAVTDHGLLLAGRLFVDDTAFGWGLLLGDGRTFAARPVPLPLATQLGVIGPTVNRDGDTVLLLDSGHSHTVARSTGLGWSLTLMLPGVSPTASFSNGAELWVVGDDVHGALSLGKLNGDVVPLPPGEFGRVRSALIHGDHLVLASEC
jgi:hypothetical protein